MEFTVGRALEGRRDQAIVATKAGLEWDEHGTPHRNASARRIRTEVEDSLRRLRTEHIDIYQSHWPDLDIPMEERAHAMAALYEAGLIRAIGVSNFSPAQLDEFAKFAPLHTVQPPYNLCERGFTLDEATRAETERIVDDEVHDPIGPEFMAPPLRAVA